MQIEQNKKINAAIDLLIEGGVDFKTVLSQDGLIKEFNQWHFRKSSVSGDVRSNVNFRVSESLCKL